MKRFCTQIKPLASAKRNLTANAIVSGKKPRPDGEKTAFGLIDTLQAGTVTRPRSERGPHEKDCTMPFDCSELSTSDNGAETSHYMSVVRSVGGICAERAKTAEMKASTEKMIKYFNNMSNLKTSTVYCARRSGYGPKDIVGLIGVSGSPAGSTIMCVLSAEKGAGSALVKHVLAQTPSTQKVSLLADTDGLVPYYERFGFTRREAGSLEMECTGQAAGPSACAVM
jgi:hypothetical protein